MRLLLFFVFYFTLTSATAATLYLTRHYEKAETHEPGLTEEGQARAHQLATYLKDKSIGKIYSTAYRRTLETSQPLSKATGINVTVYPADDLAALANTLRKSETPTVVIGHSNTTPRLIRLLGGPPVVINEDDYGTLYQLTIHDGDVTFNEALIPAD